MATWKISTREKKQCVEKEFWTRDGETIVRITGFRWGTFSVETSDDNPPEDITEQNPDGVEMYGYFSDNAPDGAELDVMEDGHWADWEWPDTMPQDQRDRISQGYDEDGTDFMEDEGWDNEENEAWLFGPLEISKIS